MKTVYHPTLPATQEVPDEDVPAWVEQGWRKTPPKGVESSDPTSDKQKGATS
jgi:hypothetical protein